MNEKPAGRKFELRGDALTGSLAAKFREEFILIQFRPSSQQLEQRIFHIVRGLVR
jgi:hypothetical protein